jgi:hypothetical protein
MHRDESRPARLARIFFGWVMVGAAIVLASGYGREIAIGLGVPASAVGGRLFELDAERNVPAWYAVLLLLTVSVTMFRTANREFGLKLGTAWGWLVLAIGFLYLAVDEQISLHEKFGQLVSGLPDMGGLFHYHWVLVALPMVLVVGVAFIPFLLRLPRDTAIRLIVAGVIYVGGGVGVEMISGLVVSEQGETSLYVLATCIEETLEVTGVLLALRTMLLHLSGLGNARQAAQPA